MHTTISMIHGNSLVSLTLRHQSTDTTSCTDPDATISDTLRPLLLPHLVYYVIHRQSGTTVTHLADLTCTTGTSTIPVARLAKFIFTTTTSSISTTILQMIDISDDMVLPYTGSVYGYTVRFQVSTHVRRRKFMLDLYNLDLVYPDRTIGTNIDFISHQLD